MNYKTVFKDDIKLLSCYNYPGKDEFRFNFEHLYQCQNSKMDINFKLLKISARDKLYNLESLKETLKLVTQVFGNKKIALVKIL